VCALVFDSQYIYIYIYIYKDDLIPSKNVNPFFFKSSFFTEKSEALLYANHYNEILLAFPLLDCCDSNDSCISHITLFHIEHVLLACTAPSLGAVAVSKLDCSHAFSLPWEEVSGFGVVATVLAPMSEASLAKVVCSSSQAPSLIRRGFFWSEACLYFFLGGEGGVLIL
jgi:hypothetical protein